MLFESYDAASRGNYHVTRGMLELFTSPYDEQPVFEEAYFSQGPGLGEIQRRHLLHELILLGQTGKNYEFQDTSGIIRKLC